MALQDIHYHENTPTTYIILPVLLYGVETWTLTKVLSAKIDSFDQWCQRRILRLHYSSMTLCPITRYAASLTAYQRPKSSNRAASTCFAITARSDVELDHHRALRAPLRGPPPTWRRQPGRPGQTWTRTTIEADLRPLNIGLHHRLF